MIPSDGSRVESSSLTEAYSGTFQALNDPWSHRETNPFIDNPTIMGDFSHGQPAVVILMLSLIEGLMAEIGRDYAESGEERQAEKDQDDK